jgi:hypothetical protein
VQGAEVQVQAQGHEGPGTEAPRVPGSSNKIAILRSFCHDTLLLTLSLENMGNFGAVENFQAIENP